MNRKEIARSAALGFVLAAVAGCASQPKHFIDPADRSPAGGREAVVMVPQGEIRAEVVASKAGASLGLVGALIDTSVNQHRANKAEAAVTPLRTALVDYNFDQRALTATQATLAQLDWLSVKKTSFSKDVSNQNENAILDKSDSPEVLMAVYDYGLSADFSALQVHARFTIAPKAVPAGGSHDDRIKLDHAIYSQTFTYLVALSPLGDDLAANCSRWSDGQAKAARSALDRGIEQVNLLLVKHLQETPGELQKIAEGSKIEAGGRKGKLIAEDAAGTLLVDDAGTWIYVSSAGAG